MRTEHATEDQPQVVAGVVLAAGRSRRMGRSKALLDADRGTFLERCVRTLGEGGCRPLLAVVRADEARAASVARTAGAEVVENPDPASEQVESLRLALAALPPSVAAAAVLPVDHPLVKPETVAALLAGFAARRPLIMRPVHAGAAGHPTVFSRAAFAQLVDRALPAGARSLIADRREDVVDLAVDDPGVTTGIDTPTAYEARFGRPPPGEAPPGRSGGNVR